MSFHRAFFFLAAVFASPLSLLAHTPGLGSLQVVAIETGAALTLTLPTPDFDHDGRISPEETARTLAIVSDAARPWLTLTRAGEDLRVTVANVSAQNGLVSWSAHVTAPTQTEWQLSAPGLSALGAGQRLFVSARRHYRMIAESLLSPEAPSIVIAWSGDVSAGPREPADTGAASAGSAGAFVRLGVVHILTGYDHLLYLAGLIATCRGLRKILPIVTSFTVAHSLTLGLATLNLVALSPAFVEPVIAASIVYVGLENLLLRDREPRGRWMLAFVFGLIHGFGFAGLLRELGVGAGGSSVVLPLLSFNAGVELGQLTMISVALPLLAWIRRVPRLAPAATPALSAVVATLGAYWFIERVWG